MRCCAAPRARTPRSGCRGDGEAGRASPAPASRGRAPRSACRPARRRRRSRGPARGRRARGALGSREVGTQQPPADQRGDNDRDVDEEHGAPAEVLEQPAAGERAEADAGPGDRGPDADRPARSRGSRNTLVMIASVAGKISAAPDAHQRARPRSAGRRADDRPRPAEPSPKIAEPGCQRAARPKRSPRLPAASSSAGEHEDVGVHDPLQLRVRRIQVARRASAGRR